MRKDYIINSIRILAVCCAVFLLAAFVRPVRAQANPSQRFVYDQAGVLSESEAAKLEKYAHKIGTDHGLDIIIVFYDQGYTPDQLRDAADDFDTDDCFGVLRAVSQETCPTVVSMVFDVGERIVSWCENRQWDSVRTVKLKERGPEEG